MTVEGAYCLMDQLGVRDDILRRELCKVKEPTLAVFDNILEAHAFMEASEKQRKKSSHANRLSTPQKKPSSQKQIMPDEEKKRHAKFKGRCFRCGAGDHMVPQCKLSLNVTCNSCKQSGHIAAVCERTSTVWATVADNPACCNFNIHPVRQPIQQHLLSMLLSKAIIISISLHRSFHCDWQQLTSWGRAC